MPAENQELLQLVVHLNVLAQCHFWQYSFHVESLRLYFWHYLHKNYKMAEDKRQYLLS
jgi:hypothetical protein